MKSQARRSWMLAAMTLAAIPMGCSQHPPAYPAAGVVLFEDGTPLAEGRIELRSTEQPYSARGAIDRDGRFRLTTYKPNDGAIAGTHQVVITQRFSADVDNLEEHRQHMSQIRTVDKKFSRYSSSGLEVEIDPKSDNTQLRLIVE